MDKSDLESSGIIDGNDIRDSLAGYDILVGNGFSINLSDKLAYKSIYDIFKKLCSTELNNVFKEFKTTNFEYIMEVLDNSIRVNTTFSKDYKYLEPLIEELKHGLINTITQTHPQYKDIEPAIFRSLAVELKDFENIYTTNYDVFLYKIIIILPQIRSLNLCNKKTVNLLTYEKSEQKEIQFGI